MNVPLAVVVALLLAVPAAAQDKRISELPDGSPGQATDAIPIARGGANYRLPFTAFTQLFEGTAAAKPLAWASDPEIGLFLPNQTNFRGTLILGNAGVSMTHASGVQGWDNTLIGIDAGHSITTANANTAVGHWALYSTTATTGNTAVGHEALYSNTTGGSNVAIGGAMFHNETGGANVAIGPTSLHANVSGGSSVAIGSNALSSSLGNNNTGVGAWSGSNVTTATNGTFVGYDTGLALQANQRANVTAIGNGARVDADNTVVLGNASVTSVLASSDGGAVVTAGAFKVGANTGISGTVVVKGSTGADCNLVFEGGILTSETCP